MRIDLTIEEFRALFSAPEAVVCGRAYDGKCPEPRLEPAESYDGDDCATCGYPVYAEDGQTVKDGHVSHTRCLERREHVEEQQVGVPPEEDCDRCGKPITNIFERASYSGGNLGGRFLHFHRACAPKTHPG